MPQEQIMAIRQLLQQQGRPITTENLNRAMLQIAQNGQSASGGSGEVAAPMEAAVTRSMQPAPLPMPPPQAPPVPVEAAPLDGQDGGMMPVAANTPTAMNTPEQEAVAAQMLAQGSGQANSMGDEMGAIIMGLPAVGGMLAGAGGSALVRAAPNLGVTLRGHATRTPRITGTPSVGNISRGGNAPPAIAGPGNAPRIGGGSGGAAARLEAPATATPRPQPTRPARSNAELRTGPQRGQQGTSPPQNTNVGQSPRRGETRPVAPGSLRERLMQRRAQQDAQRSARTGRD